MAPIQLPKIYYKGQACIVDFRLGEMRCQDIDENELARLRQKHGLETDSKSRWSFLMDKQGMSSLEAEHKVFDEMGLINPVKEIKTIRFTDLKEDKYSDIKKQLRGLRSRYWHNDYVQGVDD